MKDAADAVRELRAMRAELRQAGRGHDVMVIDRAIARLLRRMKKNREVAP